MKLSSPSLIVPAAALALAVAALAQAPSTEEHPAGNAAHHHEEPAPTNLKVLPKTMTGEQVHELMHKWAESLGTECSTCHAVDPNRKMPNGRPALNFADDSKPEKKAARLMVKMTQDINQNYVSMVPDAKTKVSCGTCHRGHVKPEAFVPPPHHDHDHPAAPAGGEKPPSSN